MNLLTLICRSPLPILLLGLRLCSASANATASTNLIDQWLEYQTTIQTWSADVIQTRSLKSLLQPLKATGHVWFSAPNLFRWELGDPPRTIAVRQSHQMLVIYPLLNRVEQYPLQSSTTGPWRDALALIEAGFPRSRTELESRFKLLASTSTNGTHSIQLQPRSASARKFMSLIIVGFEEQSLTLQFTEIRFADGSSMRNDFVRPRNNPQLPEHIFTPLLNPEWTIIEAH